MLNRFHKVQHRNEFENRDEHFLNRQQELIDYHWVEKDKRDDMLHLNIFIRDEQIENIRLVLPLIFRVQMICDAVRGCSRKYLNHA